MKAFDILYLLVALFLVAYLSLKIQELSTLQIILILALAGFASFQFSLRRQIRNKTDSDRESDTKDKTGSES